MCSLMHQQVGLALRLGALSPVPKAILKIGVIDPFMESLIGTRKLTLFEGQLQVPDSGLVTLRGSLPASRMVLPSLASY